ncbi:hypothetical protein VTN02DRAFT_6120 [Thermoascus thermophilus]
MSILGQRIKTGHRVGHADLRPRLLIRPGTTGPLRDLVLQKRRSPRRCIRRSSASYQSAGRATRIRKSSVDQSHGRWSGRLGRTAQQRTDVRAIRLFVTSGRFGAHREEMAEARRSVPVRPPLMSAITACNDSISSDHDRNHADPVLNENHLLHTAQEQGLRWGHAGRFYNHNNKHHHRSGRVISPSPRARNDRPTSARSHRGSPGLHGHRAALASPD